MNVLNKSQLFITIEVILIGSITFLHYYTPTIQHYWHELFKVLYFIPIILAALRFGLQGGLSCALIVTVLYLPHVIFQWGGDFLMNLSRFLMIVLYYVVGVLTGFLWQRERTERNRYQKVAEQLNESLRQLHAQTEKMTEIKKQLLLSERLSTLGELTANLAHEVRNPLGSIRGVAEILRDESPKNNQQKFVDILLKEVQRLDQVVANYLTYAKPQVELKELTLVEPLIESTLALVEPDLRRHNITTQIRIDPPNVQILCNEIQLRQALLNIVLNAVAACENGGKITIHVEQKNNDVTQIAITDSGHGLNEEAIQHLFEPFYTTKQNGTGLGLAITKRIVEDHDGKISAANNDTAGTTIFIEFPNQYENVEN